MQVELIFGDEQAAEWIEFQSFVIATVENDRLLRDVQAHIAEQVAQGKSSEEIKKGINQFFDDYGITRLNWYHLENVVRTNQSLAFAAGQIAKLEEVKDSFPYWRYSAVNDSRTRPSHAALHGKVFRTGDYKFYPPCGYQCRCTAIPMTEKEYAASREKVVSSKEIAKVIGKEAWKELLKDGEFIGNKNEGFMKWLAEQKKEMSKDAAEEVDRLLKRFDNKRKE